MEDRRRRWVGYLCLLQGNSDGSGKGENYQATPFKRVMQVRQLGVNRANGKRSIVILSILYRKIKACNRVINAIFILISASFIPSNYSEAVKSQNIQTNVDGYQAVLE